MSVKISRQAPIAVFDSGAGGLGVLREVKRVLPRENLFYFGDGANAPYGERPHGEIEGLVLGHAARLLSHCKALVLACNTATAVAADTLRARYPRLPIIGIEPALRPALAVKPHPRILVLATEATLAEEKFAALRQTCADRADITALPAPLLVRLVEAGQSNAPATEAYLQELLSTLGDLPPDALVLGCTHFPLAMAAIRRVFGQALPVFDGAAGTARQLQRRLRAEGLLNTTLAGGHVVLTASDPHCLSLYRALWAQTKESSPRPHQR